jgi:hypothetical protein
VRVCGVIYGLSVLMGLGSLGWAQDVERPSVVDASKDDTPTKKEQRWRVGTIVTAGSASSGIVGTVTIPREWPEQQVRVVGEDLSRGVEIAYQTVKDVAKQDVARQMRVSIPRLATGEQAKAVLTFEVKLGWRPPGDTSVYVVPDAKKMDRQMRLYVLPSPYIESNDPEIKALAEKVGADKKDAWSRVEAIYDFVREKVKYEKNCPLKGAVDALKDGTGDCNELSGLFIAICRASKVPARTVRVPGHVYPEFYLEDDKGQGRWFPCETAGTRSFGDLLVPRPILQKGDNLSLRNLQTKRMESYRFVPENLAIRNFQQGGEPKLRLICEPAN